MKKNILESRGCVFLNKKWQKIVLAFMTAGCLWISANVHADDLAGKTTSCANKDLGSNSTSTSLQPESGVGLSANVKDQENLTKLFEHAKYEDFTKHKPISGFSIADSNVDDFIDGVMP